MVEQAINPELVLEDLLSNSSSRKQKSLNLLNGLFKQHHNSNEKDSSIATIGRLSGENGGPSTQSIRNKGGSDYRQLIQVWAEYSGARMKKPAKKQSANPGDFTILQRMAVPAVRAVIASIIAECNVSLKENHFLKNQTEIIIDNRHNNNISSYVELLPAITDMLNDIEQEALAHATSESTLDKMGWKFDVTGRVKVGRTHIYRAGYITAINKILLAVEPK